MEKIKRKVGFNGDLKSFFNHVRELDELIPFNEPQEVIDNFNRIHEKMTPQVNKLFGLQPKTPLKLGELNHLEKHLLVLNIIQDL
jgi:uncharacterized protein (DUF885 family)